jgi:SEC-C motif-containing protein
MKKKRSLSERIEAAREPAELVELLLHTGRELHPALKRRILELGDRTIPPLLVVLEDEDLQMAEAPGEGWAPIHAVALLGELRAQEAIGPMVYLLPQLDPQDALYSEVIQALPALGPGVVKPALERLVAEDTHDGRIGLSEVLIKLGARDERLFEILLQFLKEETDIGAGFLANYGDPRALEPLRETFDEFEFETQESPLVNQALIELREAIQRLGGELTSAQQAKFEQGMAMREPWRKWLLEAAKEGRQPPGAEGQAEKPSRNDPCWCGSGKKYKKCHLREDEKA